jgi:hypothetical protein
MTSKRDYLFISHANPEDNEFALWLALQLSEMGYRVWCDKVRLLGGEDFWQDIEKAIRTRTIKFLYVLSRSSNKKTGPLQELQVAQTVLRNEELKDFIIPLLIDDLPHSEINIQLARLNAIPFGEGWHPGLMQLIAKLEKDAIEKDPALGPKAVSEWWRQERSSFIETVNTPEEYLTNWYPAINLPEAICFHTVKRDGIGSIVIPENLSYPGFQRGQFLISFASAKDFEAALPPDLIISDTHIFPANSLMEGMPFPSIQLRQDARNVLVRILTDAWLFFSKAKGLLKYELAGGAECSYFPLDFSQGNKEK